MSKQKSRITNWKEQRRLHALKLKGQNWKQSEIATALNVSKGAVSRWIRKAEIEGKDSLQASPHTGRPPELTKKQKLQIPDLLWHGAEAYGFRGDLWTCPRIRKVIEWEFGINYHRSHIARLMKELRWTPSNVRSLLEAGDHPLFAELLDVIAQTSAIDSLIGEGEDFSRLGGADVRRASLVMLAAPLLSALGSVCLRRWGSGISPLSLAAVPMLLTGGALGLVAAATERGQPLLWAPAPWLATLYLSLFGSALTFTLYFWLLARRSALFSSLISYTVPVIAVLVGWLFLDEPVTGRVLSGGGLVLLGVGLVMRPPRARRRAAGPA